MTDMIIPLDQLRDERAVKLMTFWRDRCKGAGFPLRHDCDPLDLAFALGNIALVEVSYDPVRFRFKLVGTDIAFHLGRDLTGTYIDQHPDPAYRDLLLSGYKEALQQWTPVAIRRDQSPRPQSLQYECILLPLSNDGKTITRFLTGVFFHRSSRPAYSPGLSAFAPPPESLRTYA